MTQQELLNYIEEQHKNRVDLVKSKSADYAKPDSDTLSNFKNSTIVGVSIERGILVRILDKISRISNLLDKPQTVLNESIIDSLNDAINYLDILSCIISYKSKKYQEKQNVQK